jgi:hypothetical protein
MASDEVNDVSMMHPMVEFNAFVRAIATWFWA